MATGGCVVSLPLRTRQPRGGPSGTRHDDSYTLGRRAVDAIVNTPDEPQAWPYHNSAVEAAKALDSVRSPHADCVRAARDLYEEPRWGAMNDERSLWFHRYKADYWYVSEAAQRQAELRLGSLLGAIEAAEQPTRELVAGLVSASPSRDGVSLIPVVTSAIADDL